MKVALLYSGSVGEQVYDFLRLDSTLEIHACAPDQWKDERDDLHCKVAPRWLRDLSPDWLILAWWPKLVSSAALACCKDSLNIHNSMLPWCRGKHPNFWALIEQVPYGVSLHAVTPRIDAGPVYVREQISYDWADTGETLHRKGQELAIDLFKRSWARISKGKTLLAQPLNEGSFHQADEIEAASEIPMGCTTGREVLNIIRARQAYGHAAWFRDGGKCYEVNLRITETPN